AAMRKNLALIETFFGRVFRDSNEPELKGRASIEVMDFESVLRPSAVKRYYESLRGRVKPEDVLLFLYAGHGGYQDGIGHFLKMSGGNVRTASVTEWMQRLAPKHSLVITEACATRSAELDDDV